MSASKSTTKSTTTKATKAAEAKAKAATVRKALSTFKASHKAVGKAADVTDTKAAKASSDALVYVTAGGKQAGLITKNDGQDGLPTKSTVSNYLTAGRAILAAGDKADDDTKRAIVRTAFGRSDGGDRPAMVLATKAGNAASVVTSAKGTPAKGTKAAGKADKGGNKAEPMNLSDMSTDAVVALIGDALDIVAVRDDGPMHAETLTKHGKFAALLGRNFAKMPV